MKAKWVPLSKQELEEFSNTFLKELESFASEHFIPDFQLKFIKYDWSFGRRGSMGGLYAAGPGINMAMTYFYGLDGPNRIYEYSVLDRDPEIGGFYSYGLKHALRMMLAHEVSHAIQRTIDKRDGTRSKPHGEAFQYYYRLLRRNFVNIHLPDQKQAKTEYDKWISDIKKLEQSNAA